jgi:hypothetical protein
LLEPHSHAFAGKGDSNGHDSVPSGRASPNHAVNAPPSRDHPAQHPRIGAQKKIHPTQQAGQILLSSALFSRRKLVYIF